MHSRLCAWFNNVSAVVWIGFLSMMQFVLHVTCSCIAFFFLLSWALSSTVFFFSFLLCLVSCLWHPRNLSLLRTRSHVVVSFPLLLPSFLILLGSVMWRSNRTSMRTFLTRWLIQNARSFCLIFQTLLFSMSLALEVGLLYVKYPRGVLVCSYRNSTPIYMPSIPMCLGLLWYSKAHIS